MRHIERVLIEEKSGKKYFVKDLENDFHTGEGIISVASLTKEGLVKSSMGTRFFVIAPTFADLWESLVRGPQVVIQKDIGLILAKTGLGKESRVVDAGGGSGSLCLSLANACREVVTYEINKENVDIITKNMTLFGVTNLTIKHQSVYKGISEQNLDVITLDVPEPWQVIGHAATALKKGGFFVVYLPNLTQVKEFIDACSKTSIRVIETVELLERKWKIEDKIMRPEFSMLGHTAFLVFGRNL